MTPEFRIDFTDGFNFKTHQKNLCAVIVLQGSLNSQLIFIYHAI